MAYNQNGQYYYSGAHQQRPSQTSGYNQEQPPDPYVRRAGSFDNGDDSPYIAAGGAADNGYGYTDPAIPARHNSVAARQNDELFIGGVPAAPPRHSPSLSGAHSQSPASPGHAPYDPRAYASQVS